MTKRLSREEARVTGAAKRNPKRHRDRAEPRGAPALGVAPGWMDAGQVSIWNAFRSELRGLTEGDRALAELATILRHRLMTGGLDGAAINQLRLVVSALRGNADDRSKIEQPEGEMDPVAKKYLT